MPARAMVRAVLSPFVWRMAWRETRHAWRRMLWFALALAVGVGAFVAVDAFCRGLEDVVDTQGRELLGADLRILARQRPTAEADAWLEQQMVEARGADVSRVESFASMAYFPRADQTRLVSVKAIEGDYPFYGLLETVPDSAARAFRRGRRALVDDTVLLQLGVEVGDLVRVGRVDYEIVGRLLQSPGQSATAALLGPRIYLPAAELDEGLRQMGSRVRFEYYYRLPPGQDAEQVARALEDGLQQHRLESRTVEESQEGWDRSIRRLRRYLHLSGFVALLLGVLGVGSAVHLHLTQKRESLLTLRCLGSRPADAVAVYGVQILLAGVLAALVGLVLGGAAAVAMPGVLQTFFPLPLQPTLAPRTVILGLLVGVGAALGSAWIPLHALQRIPPALALQTAGFPAPGGRRAAGLRLLVLCVLVWAFALLETGRAGLSLGFVAGMMAALGVLYATSRGLAACVRRYLAPQWSYVIRQGLANLYRPHNQTFLATSVVGLVTCLIVTLQVVRDTLLAELTEVSSGAEPNLVLFDIQSDQTDEIRARVEQQGLEVLDMVPIVNMRLAAVRGVSIEELRRVHEIPDWTLTREYRSTYRSELAATEELVAGAWFDALPGHDPEESRVPVSVEEQMARRLRVGPGDELVFNVQGALVKTFVASLREVDWRRVRPNFFVVFPVGVLEDAPQFHVLVTRSESAEQAAALQRDLVLAYPNVSSIDLSTILRVADQLLSSIQLSVRFMALFGLLSGLLVLVSSLLLTRLQRRDETLLLRMLGASRRQLVTIQSVEFLALGLVASLSGLLLAVAASAVLARAAFDATLVLSAASLLPATVGVLVVVWIVGKLSSAPLSSPAGQTPL